jgi:hypothetical protein
LNEISIRKIARAEDLVNEFRRERLKSRGWRGRWRHLGVEEPDLWRGEERWELEQKGTRHKEWLSSRFIKLDVQRLTRDISE